MEVTFERAYSMPNVLMGWLALTLALSIPHALPAAEHIRVLIDTDAATLLVVKGEQAMARFSDISIGRDGATSR